MELGLNNILGVSRIATHGQAAPETLAPYQRALELSEKAGDTPETFQALFGVRTHFLFTGEHNTAAALAARGLEIAERLEDEDLLLEGHLNVGNSHFWAGEHDHAIRHLGWVVDNYRPDQHHRHLVQYAQNPRITAIFPLAHSLWAVGRTAEAEALVDSTVALAIELEHSFSQALAIQTEAFLRCQLRQPELVEQSATRLIEIAKRAGFPVYIPVGNVPLGWARAVKGDTAGRQLTEEASTLLQSSGMGVSRTLFSVLLADAAIAIGDIGGAREVAEAAFDWGRRTGEQVFLPELRRLQATASEPTEAVSLLSDAIELASRQGAVSFEFRSRVDLAALIASAGRPVEAFGILEPALHMSPPSIAEADRLATLAEDLGERQPDGEDHHVE
jgi:tetratricopeptide (TPR) repeat protein